MGGTPAHHRTPHGRPREPYSLIKRVLGVAASIAIVAASFFGAFTYASGMRTQPSLASNASSSTPKPSPSSPAASSTPGKPAEMDDSALHSSDPASVHEAASERADEEAANVRKRGVDVSEVQGNIDWHAVAEDGIEFAFVRVGYRGSYEGEIYADEKHKINLAGARSADIACGAYFYSQATSVAEAEEEARWAVRALGGMKLDYPLAFDYEVVGPNMRSRIANVSPKDATKIARAFCETVEKAGYQAMIYGNVYDLEHLVASDLDEWPIWYAEYSDQPSYSGNPAIWQYSCTGQVNGIEGEVDLNVDLGGGSAVSK